MPPLFQAVTPDTSALRDRARGQAQDAWSNASQYFQTASGAADGYAEGMSAWNNYGQTAAAMTPPGTSTGGNNGSSALTGGAGMEAYNNRLRELGWSENAIMGNAWNVQDESGWNFGAVGDNGSSFGANQWYGPRQKEYFAYADANSGVRHDPVTQANFLDQDVRNKYGSVFNKAQNAGSPNEAAVAFLEGYEIPAKVHMDRRRSTYLSR